MKMKKRIALGVILAAAAWIIWSNVSVQISHVDVESTELPSAFHGFRIAQVSDFHDAALGEKVIAGLENVQPDIIAFTGDMIDSHRLDVENTLAFARRAAEIAPVYYVNGNHEALIPEEEYKTLTDGLRACGAVVLEDECAVIERGAERVRLIGLNDIGHLNVQGVEAKIAAMRQVLEEFVGDKPGFNLALSHRPELIDAYAETGVDLVLSGHAHGGQFRLPFIGGLAAPGQGLLPEYDSGLYTQSNTQMIVSRGVGNSIIPIRFNNRPEIVIIELKTK